jgi:ubiquinone/menaquinone biosynthesis C-methylase UbiE
VRYAHDPAAYEAEEWSRPDEMALFQCLWSYTRRELDTRPNSRLLDLCCGSGMSLLGAVSHPHLAHAVGVDLSLRLLDFARCRYAPFENVSFVCGDAVQQIFKSASFDIVIASSAYHHIEPHRKSDFLAVCNQLLKPEGRLMVAENVLPPYRNEGTGYDDAVGLLYSAVIRSAMSQYPDLPVTIRNMIDENVRLSVRREYEYKVDRQKLLQDFSNSGFTVQNEVNAWPIESGVLPGGAGNVLFVLEKRDSPNGSEKGTVQGVSART